MADRQALEEFALWVAGCSGNKKQEARTFIEKLMRAWGWDDSTEAKVCFEEHCRGWHRVRRRSYQGQGVD